MHSSASGLLDTLAEMDAPSLRVWVRDVLKHDRATPDCIGAEERPAHLRLLDICNWYDAAITRVHRIAQESVRDAAWKLCGCYRPQRDGGHLGLELLQFAHRTRCAEAVRSFGVLLAQRAFDPADPAQLNLWLEAHWTVPDALPGWDCIRGWVLRDAGGEPFVEPFACVPLNIRISALGVGARFCRKTEFESLARAIQRAVTNLRWPDDTSAVDTLVRHTVLLYHRMVDEEEEPYFPPFQARLKHDRNAWKAFGIRVGHAVFEAKGSTTLNMPDALRILRQLGLHTTAQHDGDDKDVA